MAEIHYGATLTDFLTAAVAQFPQRPATYFAGHTLTYSELDAQVAAAAGALHEMGAVSYTHLTLPTIYSV